MVRKGAYVETVKGTVWRWEKKTADFARTPLAAAFD